MTRTELMGAAESQRRANVRLALILAAMAAAFALGFVAKIWMLGPD